MTLPARASRLKEAGPAPSIEPFVRAPQMTSASLYWLGVASWPPAYRDRQWLLAFFNKFTAWAETEFKVVPLQFLTMNVAGNVLRDPLIRNGREVMPIMGAMSRPGRKPVPMPTAEEIDQATKKKLVLPTGRNTADFTYWFVRGKHEYQRSLFQGYGGMTILLTAPDESSKIDLPRLPDYMMNHPSMAAFKKADMKSELQVAEMLSSDFGAKSKALFGEPYQDLALFPGLPFVIPQWSSSTFFDSTPELLESLFKLCKVYVQESVEDKGILLACDENLDAPIDKIVQELKTESQMEYRP